MALRIVVLAVVGALMCGEAARADTETCWQTVYKAIAHSVAQPHPPFTSYTERTAISQDGSVVQRALVKVLYRDDGLALIDDSRWTYPMLTNTLEPGPPVLGPYGEGRDEWLALADNATSYPVISTVHTKPRGACGVQEEAYNGRETEHVVLPDAPTDHPALKALWIDAQSEAIWKVLVSGLVQFHNIGSDVPHFADFQVEFQQVNGYTVVRHVTWQYRLQYYTQYSNVFGEYYFTGYTFPENAHNTALDPHGGISGAQ